MRLVNLDLASFLNEVASPSPAPGGGSVAALCAALGSALGAMVCENALNKKQVNHPAVRELLTQLSSLRASLLAAVDADTEAFNLVMRAWALPKDQADIRQRALAQATEQATRVPLQVAEHCALLSQLLREVTRHARKSLASDLGAGVAATAAALQGAAYNVTINLPGLDDASFRDEATRRLHAAEQVVSENLEEVRGWVTKSLS